MLKKSAQPHLLSALISSLLLISVTGWSTSTLAETPVSNDTTTVTFETHHGQQKTITLPVVHLSSPTQRTLITNIKTSLAHPAAPQAMMKARASGQPGSIYLGMNDEPVLDQGPWGTCATFATTGAINALYYLKDDARISQLCHLQAARTLNNPPGADGGWDGSYGYAILTQMNDYGYLPLSYQKQQSCGGLTEYPIRSTFNGSAMDLDTFKANSTRIFTKNDWFPILNLFSLQQFKPLSIKQSTSTLDEVKQALLSGHRIVFGTLLLPDIGLAGATGKFKTPDDTWALVPDLLDDLDDLDEDGRLAGHEMIIIGFDDNACASYDDDNLEGLITQKQQCGLLRLRNSWGADIADQGDFYMTYDYFRHMVLEAYAIGGKGSN